MIPVPLLSNLNAPLVAQLDVNAINIELKAYIQQEIANGVQTAIEQLAANIVNKKVNEATVKLGESIKEKFVHAKSEIQGLLFYEAFVTSQASLVGSLKFFFICCMLCTIDGIFQFIHYIVS